jgi:hypothetical protein
MREFYNEIMRMSTVAAVKRFVRCYLVQGAGKKRVGTGAHPYNLFQTPWIFVNIVGATPLCLEPSTLRLVFIAIAKTFLIC